MTLTVAVDANVLYASIDRSDRQHETCVALLERSDLSILVPSLVIPEVAHLVGRRVGARAEAAFAEGLRDILIECPTPLDWPRIAQLTQTYRDWPLGIVDASIVALCERLEIGTLLTLDRRHFGPIRPLHRPSFDLLP